MDDKKWVPNIGLVREFPQNRFRFIYKQSQGLAKGRLLLDLTCSHALWDLGGSGMYQLLSKLGRGRRQEYNLKIIYHYSVPESPLMPLKHKTSIVKSTNFNRRKALKHTCLEVGLWDLVNTKSIHSKFSSPHRLNIKEAGDLTECLYTE